MNRRLPEALYDELRRLDDFPRDISLAVLASLPLSIVSVGRLSIELVNAQLARRNIGIECGVENRQLRGCLVAEGDVGFIFIDGLDHEAERRFSVAHETAHYLVDYLSPRRRAVAHFGDMIQPVLDGLRPPDQEEKVDAFLARVPLRAHVHVMERDGQGQPHCESLADDLAYEMLAPRRLVRLQVQGQGREAVKAASGLLVAKFGLPPGAAMDYASMLFGRVAPIPIRTLLGF